MDDQFLHQLRRDPPVGFASTLKWRLDRPAPPIPSWARLFLVLAIFGTAFALVSPQENLPFYAMLERRTPIDLQIARTSASGLNELSAMIPDVFVMDTRRFDVNTRALNNIWSAGEYFGSKAEALTLAAAELHVVVDERVEKACNACHLVYRRH